MKKISYHHLYHFIIAILVIVMLRKPTLGVHILLACICIFIGSFRLSAEAAEEVASMPIPFSTRSLAITSDTGFNFDLKLVIPIPVLGNATIGVEFRLATKINFLNATVDYHAIRIPYFVLPEPKPITFDLTAGNDNSYYSYDQDPYGYNSPPQYPQPDYQAPYFETSRTEADDGDDIRRNLFASFRANDNKKSKSKKMNKKSVTKKSTRRRKKSPKWLTKKSLQSYSQIFNRRPSANLTKTTDNLGADLHRRYRLHKRSVAEASAQHRYDLFAVAQDTLDRYGFDGEACLCRAVCELAEMELLIESPAHEIVEHLLRVSRTPDSDGLLRTYLDAEKFGHQSFKSKKRDACKRKYSRCAFSIFDRRYPFENHL